MILFSQWYSKYVKIIIEADVDSIHKQIIKTVDFENIAKELDDRIHTLTTDGKQ